MPLPHLRGRVRILYTEAAYPCGTAAGHQKNTSYCDVRGAAHHRENLQEEHTSHGEQQPHPLLDAQAHTMDIPPSGGTPPLQDIRRQTALLRHRRQQAGPGSGGFHKEMPLPLCHRLRAHRMRSPRVQRHGRPHRSGVHRNPRLQGGRQAGQRGSQHRRGGNSLPRRQCHAGLL